MALTPEQWDEKYMNPRESDNYKYIAEKYSEDQLKKVEDILMDMLDCTGELKFPTQNDIDDNRAIERIRKIIEQLAT